MRTGRPLIFDEKERSDPQPRRNNETTFSFLNRIQGPFWEQPRQLVQNWADRLAEDAEYRDVRARLRADDDYSFNSAFLELYLHESFIAAGYDVTVHPSVAGTSRRPDFMIRRGDVTIYVEAIAPAPSDAQRRAAARVRELLHTVDTVDDPNFWLGTEELIEGSTPPSGSRLRSELRQWLSGLNPETSSLTNAPRHRWRRDGWEMEVIAIPKGKSRGQTGSKKPSIGVYGHTKAGIYSRAPVLRAALFEKHRAYGALDAPFVVAVGHYSIDVGYWHATAALYGDEVIRVGVTATGEQVTVSDRDSNGFFGTPPTWARSHVSGVLLINQLTPESCLRADVTMWRNPASKFTLPDEIGVPGDTIDWRDSQLTRLPPRTTAPSLFGLPKDWPLGSLWPD